MDINNQLALSFYKTISVINEPHNIYLVKHRETNKIYVRKTLDIFNPDVYQYLYNHPAEGVPQIIELCEDNGKLVVIEEYIHGTGLQELIDNASYSINDAVNYIIDICNILDKLHNANPPIIHRDIKPSNIVITNYNRAVLLDFNAARIFCPADTRDTVLLGTQGYAAPEQYGFGASSAQTDIYSLGIVLKEMLEAIHISNNTQASEASGITVNGYNLNELFLIIEKATRINPDDRFNSVSELARHLKLSCQSVNISDSGTDVYTKTALHSHKKSYALPGFRTRTPWKMTLSCISYLFILWMCLTLEFKDFTSAGLIWSYRITSLAMLASVIFICFDYRNIQSFFPLCKSRNIFVKAVGIILFCLIAILTLAILLAIIQGVFFPN